MIAVRRYFCAFALLLCTSGLAAGCGRTRDGGESGSETHWLVSCETTADCRAGQCLCGICTEPCRVALDCPAPLDVCSASLMTQENSCHTAICSSSLPGEIEAKLEGAERRDECIHSRPTSLVLLADRPTALGVFSNAELGFFVADFVGRLRRVSLDGRLGFAQEGPSELLPQIGEIVPLADGSALLAGSVADFDGNHGWVAKVGADWSVLWERELELVPASVADLVALPDGGAVILSFREQEQASDGEKRFDAAWARISASGEMVWQQQESFQSPRFQPGWSSEALALTDAMELRIAVATKNGVRVIFGSLDGEKDVRTVEPDLQTFAHITALPGGGFALVSQDSHVAVLDATGSLLWQRDYANETSDVAQNRSNAVAFNVARQELVLVGSNAQGGSWLQALDLAGEPTWQLSLLEEAGARDGHSAPLSAGHGPQLDRVAVGPDGSLLAIGTSGDLFYLWVGAGSCD